MFARKPLEIGASKSVVFSESRSVQIVLIDEDCQMHERYVKILLKDYVEPMYLYTRRSKEWVNAKMHWSYGKNDETKPNRNELDYWRCAVKYFTVNQGPQYLFNVKNTQIMKYVHRGRKYFSKYAYKSWGHDPILYFHTLVKNSVI